MDPMRRENTAVFQALVDALIQPFTPLSFTSEALNSPDAWITAYRNQLQSVIITTGTLSVEDLDHISDQLYPRCALFTLGYAKTHGKITVVRDLIAKMRIWSQSDIITQFVMFQTILETLRTFLSSCGLSETGFSTLDMILRFDILFITAKILNMMNDKDQRLRFRSEKAERAQALLDLLQSLLDCHPQGSARARLLDITFRLSKESGNVPSCLLLMNLEKEITPMVSWGSYGDIWGGKIGENRVAIKSIRNLSASHLENVIMSFAREAVLWRQFYHPNVLPFYGVHLWPREPRPMVCLVSPWMENGNVTEYLQKPKSKGVPSLILDIARGIEYLHNFKPPVIHGDLKGNNILITPSGDACIADFGLCTFTQDHAFQVTNRNSTGAPGAMLYCAPELLSPESSESSSQQTGLGPGCKSMESDIYAFGCLCFEMFTGRPRFSNIPALLPAMLAISNQAPIPQPTNMEPIIWDLIQECWDKHPYRRPTMPAIVRRLNSFVESKDDRDISGHVFRWDEQIMSQLNSPWAASKTPFGLKHDTHRNMASVPMLLSDQDISTISQKDIIIALMGPSGVGKSSFINVVLGHEVATVGKTMDSCTQTVRAHGCLHPDGSERKVIMVDTPGFDDSDKTDYEVLKDIVDWLTATYKQDIVLTGIIQLHSIAETRMRGTPRKNLEVFRQLCGNDALKNVILATTYWDKTPLDIATMRESQLKTEFWGQMLEQGCRMDRFYPPTMDRAWTLISQLDNRTRRPALTVQTEIVVQGKKLHQTSAFGALFQWWNKKLESLRGRFRRNPNKQLSEKELLRAEKEMKKMTRNNSTRSSSIGDYVLLLTPTRKPRLK